MAKNTDRQDIENFTDSFRGYVRHCSAKSSKGYWLHSKGQSMPPMKRCCGCIGTSAKCYNKAKMPTVEAKDLATAGCGLEERLYRDKRFLRAQYAVHDTVFQRI